ncbi:MAG: replication initiator protein [Microvirus sp.]|nr:MAG: replication initiator protein [Microvirus sp.]
MSTRCMIPIRTRHGDWVPCGRCNECTTRRISGWTFRLSIEEKYSTSAHFITLTYAPEHVPTSPVGKRLTLHKPHVQAFIRKLRKSSYWGNNIKYYAVGEYGTLLQRPHYHLLLFNVPSLELLQPAWPHGQIYYGSITPASVGYCFKYLCKERKIPAYKADDRCPEFGLFSKHLGKGYITPEMKAWHLDDLKNRMYIPMPGGGKIAMPRYYKERIYTPGQRRFFELHFAQIQEKQYIETYRSPNATIRRLQNRKDYNAYQAIQSGIRRRAFQYFQSRQNDKF